MDENVYPAKFGRLRSAFPYLGFGGALLVWGGWALPWGVGLAGRWVRALGKYLDPVGDRDR